MREYIDPIWYRESFKVEVLRKRVQTHDDYLDTNEIAVVSGSR